MSAEVYTYEQAIIDTVTYHNPNKAEVVPGGWFEVANEAIAVIPTEKQEQGEGDSLKEVSGAFLAERAVGV
jgi:hypothetical protein